MVTVVGGIAEIEAANTSTRVASLWDYNKTQSDWLVGKPAYGYETAENEDGRVVLTLDRDAYRALHRCRNAATGDKPASARRMVKVLVRAGLGGPGLTASTQLRRLRNPALMGYRVEEDKNGGVRRSKIVLGSDAKPIRVADPIFTEDEFNSLQEALDHRGKNQPTRRPDGATKFLGVLICNDCGSNMTVQNNRDKDRAYSYLRCGKCKAGGYGAPNPAEIYGKLVDDVLRALGDEPVVTREYRLGAKARKEQQRLEQSISYYMTGLEPEGRFTQARFTKEQAEKTLDDLIKQLEAVDPESTKDRWVEGVRAPHIHMKLMIPKDVRDRLTLKEDDFAEAF